MKKLLSIATLFLLALNVQAFSIQAECYVQGGVSAQCRACNYDYYQPIVCHMEIAGVSSYGAWFNAAGTKVMYPGDCMDRFVYANDPRIDPLVNAGANVKCRF